jgi:hypothetical protein
VPVAVGSGVLVPVTSAENGVSVGAEPQPATTAEMAIAQMADAARLGRRILIGILSRAIAETS